MVWEKALLPTGSAAEMSGGLLPRHAISRGARMPGDDGYTGTQPIRVLDYNVLAWFEGKYPDFRRELEDIGEQFGIPRAIKYSCGEVPILAHEEGTMLPFVEDDGQIVIHETFLAYIWALSYAFLVIFDEKLHGPHTDTQPAHGRKLGYFLPKGYALLNYALGLITKFSKWLPDLPNPEDHKSEDRYFVERANAIYLAAVDFVLCHELGHIASGHLERLKQAQGRLTSPEQKAFEREADRWALEHVLKGVREPDRSMTTVGFGAIAGLGSLLFLNRGLTSQTHPDKDERIRNVLLGLQIDDLDNLWGVAAAFYVAWDIRFSAGLELSPQYETYGALVRAIDTQLESKKQDGQERRLRLD